MESDLEQIKDQFHKEMNLVWDSRPTRIIAVAVAKDEDRNSYAHISTSYGKPLNESLHDMVRDRYEICCTDFFELGTVGFSLQMELSQMFEWLITVPIPFSIIETHLSKDRMDDFKDWKKLFPEDEYQIEFLQMLGCY